MHVPFDPAALPLGVCYIRHSCVQGTAGKSRGSKHLQVHQEEPFVQTDSPEVAGLSQGAGITGMHHQPGHGGGI